MSARWTVPRVVNRVHRDVLAPLGFGRKGNVCTRADGGLLRKVWFYSRRWGDPDLKGIQILLMIQVAGLPDPVTERRDALWTSLEAVRGLSEYPRPAAAAPPPAELIEDVAGPAMRFVGHPADLVSFAAMAREVHDRGRSWGPFRYVYPQGTGPLQVAAFAAVMAGEDGLADQMCAVVLASEAGRREGRDFAMELTRLRSA